MRILLVTQQFWPENFRINDLAIELVKRGYEVDVLTGQPNYPDGKFYGGYGFNFSNEKYCGINIIRIPIIPRGKNYFTLALNYISFALIGSFFLLMKNKKYDKIFAVNYSPITAIIPAIIFKIKNKIKLFIWVQDLWPESVKAATNFNFFGFYYILEKIVKTIYSYSDKIFISNNSFAESIVKKGVIKDKIEFMPNWAEDIFDQTQKVDYDRYKKLIPSGFTVMFAGNMGEAQDLENVLKAIECTGHEINWVFLGKGRKFEWFSSEIKKKRLSSRVKILGGYPLNEMPNFFCHADLMLVSLKDDYIFNLTMPGKVQSYMSFGKPIVAMLNGEGNIIIQKANCGYCANSSDYKNLSNNINMASKASSSELEEMGKSGMKYYKLNFNKNKIINKLCNNLES